MEDIPTSQPGRIGGRFADLAEGSERMDDGERPIDDDAAMGVAPPETPQGHIAGLWIGGWAPEAFAPVAENFPVAMKHVVNGVIARIERLNDSGLLLPTEN